MIYLDTGCFVKLYYPEKDSAQVIALIQGKAIYHTPLHELEFVNALQLKVFLQNATARQVDAARALVAADCLPCFHYRSGTTAAEPSCLR